MADTPAKVTADTPERAAQRRAKGKTMGRRSTFKYLGAPPGNSSFAKTGGAGKSPEEAQLLADALRGNPNLNLVVRLSDSHIQELVDVALKEEFATGQTMMIEGELSNELFYIVQEGEFEIETSTPVEILNQNGMSYLCRPQEPDGPMENKPKVVRTVGKGLCVGDRSMVFNQPRLATVRAKIRSSVWRISQSEFKKVQQEAIQERQAAGTLGMTPEEDKLLTDALRFNANLQRLVPLNSEHIRQIVAVACRQELAEGQHLMYEGDLNAEAFYIVGEGSLEACGSEPFEVIKEGEVSYFHRAAHTGQHVSGVVQGPTICVVERGHCFGEISMLHCAPRFATLKALERTVLWVIDRSNFQIIQMKGAEEHMRNRVRYLEDLEVCSNLPHGGRDALAGLMETMRFTEGEVMLRQGAVGTALYILYEGAVAVEVDGQEQQRLEANPSEGTHHHFSEGALRKDKKQAATVRVTSPAATALVLERADFISVWDQVIEGATAPAFERLYTKQAPSKNALLLPNLAKVGLLGAASFGPVELVKHEASGETYALKTMSKGLVARRGMIASVAQEKGVWEMCNSPFIVKLVTTFSEPQSFSLLLEPALGGDLASIYDLEGLHGSVQHAQYYLAGITLALGCLHRLKVAYRNLKPTNVLLNSLGHPKVTDMGLAKVVIGQTFTVCGAPNYMAPEVLAGTGHARAVDWWALGVLAFELMAGRTPFESDHPMRVYWNVMRGIARVELPEACRGAAGDFLSHLLKPQAIERLPMRQGGISNIMEHSWFSGFNWQAMQAVTLDPPYKPKLQGATDLSSFLPCPADVPQAMDFGDEDMIWAEEFGAP